MPTKMGNFLGCPQSAKVSPLMIPTAVSHTDVIAFAITAAVATSITVTRVSAVSAVTPAAHSFSPTLDTLSLVLSLMGMLGYRKEVYQVAKLNKELYYDEDVWDSINSYAILYGAVCANNPTRLDFLSKRGMSHQERLKGNFDGVMKDNFGKWYILIKMNAHLSNKILYDNQTRKEIGREWKLRQEIETHRFNVVQFLCKCGLPVKGPILNQAVKYRNYALVDFLCKQGAYLNVQQPYDGKTPLHIALEQYIRYSDSNPAHRNRTDIPILRSLFKRMKNLSKEETGINLQMKDGSTALHWVLLSTSPFDFSIDYHIFYRIELVKVLCKLQIDTTLVTNKGQTAYDIACENYGADSDIAKLLETYPH